MSILTSGGENSRCTMGIEGLDDVLGSGVPRNRIHLVQGDPGMGRKTLALQFLLEGARRRQTVALSARSIDRHAVVC